MTSGRQTATADALAGALASLVSLWTFYPVDVIKSRLQSSREGAPMDLSKLFAGCQLKTLHTASSSFCYFYLYSWIFSWWRKRSRDAPISVPTRLLLSALAAMLNTCVTYPLDSLSTAKQASNENENDNSNAQVSLNGRFRYELAHWSRGLVPALCLCSNPSIHYTVYDFLKSQLLTRRNRKRYSHLHSLSMAEAFLLGLVAKGTATIVTYPLIRAKMMLMVNKSPSNSPWRALWECLRTEYHQGSLYRGYQLQLLHTMLKSALLMMVREKIVMSTRRLVVQ